jgi:Zn-dependent peptidase ImmA (M78 family)
MTTSPSPLTSLRALLPRRVVNFNEALQIAEQQARRLVDLIDDIDGIHELHVAQMPRMRIVREDLPVSGLSYWNGQEWVIALSRSESQPRQRFTLLHEFKHIVDHGSTASLYPGDSRLTSEQQAEAAADYFAGCALVDKRQLKSAWGNRIQRVEDLASHFSVSLQAMRVRLSQTGLDVIADSQPAQRCARPVTTSRSDPQRFRAAQPRYSQRRYA